MNEWMAVLERFLTLEKVLTGVRVALLLLAGMVAARLVSRGLVRLVEPRLDRQQVQLLRRAAFYLVMGLFMVAALHQMGFQIGVLLGAAGVFSVAIGFASQTSASNFISGLFLVVERPFSVGDVIHVGGTTGEVLAVDLLSIKLRTFDNLFVRIPNETLIKSEVRTLTRFPIRRVDIKLGVAYDTDLGELERVLFELAEREPLSLEEPRPVMQYQGFGDSSIDLQLSVWALRENFIELRNRMYRGIQVELDRHGIVIPFPQRSLQGAADGEPLPVRLVAEGGREEGGPAAADGDAPSEGK